MVTILDSSREARCTVPSGCVSLFCVAWGQGSVGGATDGLRSVLVSFGVDLGVNLTVSATAKIEYSRLEYLEFLTWTHS